MKLRQIALACTAAFAVSMAAQAAPPTGPYDTAGAVRVFLVDEVGGRTTDAIVESLLKPGFYRYTAGPDYHLYLGETIAIAPADTINFPVNQKILITTRTKSAAKWVLYAFTCPFVVERLQIMILNATVCPTAAVAGGATASCISSGINSAIVGQDPGESPLPTGQEESPDFYASITHPFMLKGPFNLPYNNHEGCF